MKKHLANGSLLSRIIAVLCLIGMPLVVSGRAHAADGNGSLDEALYAVQEMYVAYYGRPADPPGLEYWGHRLEEENGLATVLDAFGNSREFTNNYGTLAPTELVNGLYNQMFGRDAEADGLAFYTSRLENGAAGLAVIAKQIADGAQGEDAVILANRVRIANEFTESIAGRFTIDLYGPWQIPAAQDLMSLVTSDIDSLAVAYEALDAWSAEDCPSCTTIRAERRRSIWQDRILFPVAKPLAKTVPRSLVYPVTTR